MHYPDGTPYACTRSRDTGRMLNVGWLARGQAFPTGACPDGFVERLLALCTRPVDRKRGSHACDLGCRGDERFLARLGDRELWLGNGEVQADGADGTGYRAPTLILHYILCHHYLPPPEFVAAVLNTPAR